MTEDVKMNVEELKAEIRRLDQIIRDAREKIRDCEDKLDRTTAVEDHVRFIFWCCFFLH